MRLLAIEIRNRLLSSKTRETEVMQAQETLQNPESHSNQQLVEAWAIIGNANMWEKETEQCEQAYLHCVDIINSMHDNTLLSECYEDLGFALSFCEKYEKAITYYKEAVRITQDLKDPERLAHMFSQMARCCAISGLMEQERVYLRQAIELPIDTLIKATLVERIGVSYANSGQYAEAARYHEEAFSMFERNNYKRYWEERINELVKIYQALEDEEAVQRTLKRKQ